MHVGIERPLVIVDDKLKAILKQSAEHQLRGVEGSGIGGSGEHIEAIVIEPGGAADHAIVIVEAPRGANEIRHGGLMQFVAAAGVVASAHSSESGVRAGANVGGFKCGRGLRQCEGGQ